MSAAPLQALYLEVVPVIGVNQEVNLTAVLQPLNPNLTVFYWWVGHSLQVRWRGPGSPSFPRLPPGIESGAGAALRRAGQDTVCGTVEGRQVPSAPSAG